MISTWAVLLLCAVGALCVEHEHIGKLPRRTKSHPSLGIFNGKKTSVAKYPYIASLLQDGEEFGAAVILNKHWLLTTGFTVGWVSIDELEFRVGSNYFDKQGQVLKASKVIAHPNYTGSWDWDIAVVKTNKPIKLGKNVKPIKLGTNKLKGGTKAWVAGWGEYDSTGNLSENLLEAQVTVYDWNKCEQIYADDLTERLMCTLDKKVAPCYGDFGDPVVVKGELYGLFAGGYGCDPNATPVLYTDVPSLYMLMMLQGDFGDPVVVKGELYGLFAGGYGCVPNATSVLYTDVPSLYMLMMLQGDFGDPLVVNGELYGLFAGGYGCDPNATPVLYTDVPSLYMLMMLQGDFGDPVVVKGELYGLFAGGYGCNPNATPVLYTDVPSLYEWVQSTITSDEDDQE